MAGRVNNILFHPLFLAIVLLSGCNKLLEISGYSIPFIHAYMDDVFCMPFVLTIALFILRKFVLKDEQYRLSKGQIVSAIIYCTILFELILPQFSATYTSDIFDVIAYILGGILFQISINKPQLIPKVSLAECNNSNASSLV